MRRFAFAAMAVCVLLGAVPRMYADDSTIAENLATQLRQAKASGELQSFRIGVRVEDGVVWLTGTVSDEAQRQKALDIARRIDTVRLVVNDLKCRHEGLGRPIPTESQTPQFGSPPLPTDLNRSMASSPVVVGSGIMPVSGNGTAEVPRGLKSESTSMPYALTARASNSPSNPVSVPSTVAGSGSEAYPVAGQFVAVQAVPAVPTQGLMPVPTVTTPQPLPVAVPYPVQAVPAYVQMVPVVPYPVPQMNVGPPEKQAAPTKPTVSARPAKPARLVSYCADGSQHSTGGVIGGFSGDLPSGAMYDGAYFGGSPGTPVPESRGGMPGGVVYDNPQMPNYAWPSYAAYPNYAAVSYPTQYSPMAWPYIGPFYPYPQVPLGWRKVCLEWDDGWWMLDFRAK